MSNALTSPQPLPRDNAVGVTADAVMKAQLRDDDTAAMLTTRSAFATGASGLQRQASVVSGIDLKRSFAIASCIISSLIICAMLTRFVLNANAMKDYDRTHTQLLSAGAYIASRADREFQSARTICRSIGSAKSTEQRQNIRSAAQAELKRAWSDITEIRRLNIVPTPPLIQSANSMGWNVANTCDYYGYQAELVKDSPERPVTGAGVVIGKLDQQAHALQIALDSQFILPPRHKSHARVGGGFVDPGQPSRSPHPDLKGAPSDAGTTNTRRLFGSW